jgi:beta-N-acetylhexosaminidase
MATLDLPLSTLCGQLLVGGFSGATLPARFEKALREGRRGGAILFRRNLPDIASSAELCRAIVAAAGPELPPFIGVDQEGGRVTRLPPPFLTLPPMRTLASYGDLELTQRAAKAVGVELQAIGFNLDFAPVLDVDSNPDNPIIGDRSFGRDPRTVMRFAVAFMRGLQEAGVLACGKHYPGHGDTSVDSHVGLPVLTHDKGRFDRIELPPFRAASGAGIASLMTAHVVCDALDPGVPATMSRAICGSLLRAEIGFEGVLFSDDLEMAAVADRYAVEESAVESVWAGCDVLLVCKDEDVQDRAHEALVRRAESDSRFRDRCVEAATRALRIRKMCPPRPMVSDVGLLALVGGPRSQAIARELAERAAGSNEAT